MLESLRSRLSMCSSHIVYETLVAWYKGFVLSEKMIKLFWVRGFYLILCMFNFIELTLSVCV